MVAAGAAFWESKGAQQRIVTSALWTGRTIPRLDCFGARPPSHWHTWVLFSLQGGRLHLPLPGLWVGAQAFSAAVPIDGSTTGAPCGGL